MKWFNRMSVGSRLTIGFGLAVALLVAVAAGAWGVLNSVKSGVDVIVKENNRKTELAYRMRGELETVARAVRNVIISRNQEVQAAQQAVRTEAMKKFDAAYEELGQLLVSEEERKTYAAIDEFRKQVLPLVQEALDQALSGQKETAGETLLDKVQGPQTQWFDALATMIALQAADTQHSVEGVNRGYTAATVGLLIGVALAVSLSTTLALLIAASLMRQLGGEPEYARAVVRQMASGDLSGTITLRSGDTRSLLFAMKEMQTSLREVVEGIQGAAESVSTASGEIAQGNHDLSSRTEMQASNLQQTSASMMQLTGTVQNNTASARQATQLADTASGVAAKGGQVVGEVVHRMEEIRSSSQKITEIISVIDAIAFQTNILALNAAVEAARAGEQGRGFAVVAGEVRSLAQRSAEAAKEIKTLISDSVEKVEGGSRLVQDAGTTMSEIVDQVKHVATLIGEINRASVEQESGITQIGKAVEQLDHMTQQNAALVEQSAAAAESLREQAGKLTKTVGVFRLAA
ncbi:methyl-accepting chemotaxis protein [Caldimonas brevitalea]|uniref:Methyl-accepting chemotaxis protein I serine chemoreceptor protein n=1 Tax=Caldimonas brevitalea TaxID=413882 RepID=A0A0G3BVG3_9BURK|nr:methyl-accepting chemotaxis protein [Caldimonas brevitalea]AKJ32018.1 methyl-accepting chemotaxis protein I serine chemoreceptor protein [Caldimonas brevitalea]